MTLTTEDGTDLEQVVGTLAVCVFWDDAPKVAPVH